MLFSERPLRFLCHESWLYGILSLPEQAASKGVLIVVGGPQYRIGSHRQFTTLSRFLATHGIPVMRFDFRGMGDSEGQMRTFEEVGDDLRSAVNQFFQEVTSLKELVIWGLCDAASAALFYAPHDKRVSGLVLLNPWVRTEQGVAKAYLRHYYLTRFFEKAFWQKVLFGRMNYIAAIQSFFQVLRNLLASKKKTDSNTQNTTCNHSCSNASLPDRMLNGFKLFKGKILLITSGDDLTAKEFLDLVKESRKWQELLKSSKVQCHNLPHANHTFSSREWRDQVATWTFKWLKGASKNSKF